MELVRSSTTERYDLSSSAVKQPQAYQVHQYHPGKILSLESWLAHFVERGSSRRTHLRHIVPVGVSVAQINVTMVHRIVGGLEVQSCPETLQPRAQTRMFDSA